MKEEMVQTEGGKISHFWFLIACEIVFEEGAEESH